MMDIQKNVFVKHNLVHFQLLSMKAVKHSNEFVYSSQILILNL